MTIRVLMFASLAAQTGRRELSIEMPDGATAGDAVRKLAEQFPPVAALQHQLAVAVDMEYVNRHHRLSDGCELALIPPVSGGSGVSGATRESGSGDE